jgi:hypothetical protein
MNRRDWALLAIRFGESKGLSPVQLQKSLFLLGRELPEEVGPGFYEFRPYNYGPFDTAVYEDAEILESQGLVNISRGDSRRSVRYKITPAGIARSDELSAQASPRALQYLDTVVHWAQQLSFNDLVRAIYDKYPEYRANSVFQG